MDFVLDTGGLVDKKVEKCLILCGLFVLDTLDKKMDTCRQKRWEMSYLMWAFNIRHGGLIDHR